MSSVGQAVGGIVGGVIGWFVGGPSGAMYGISLGSGIGGMLDPPKGPTLLGPRLSDLSVQTSTYGANLPRIYGTVATMGNVFWLENDQIKETPHKKKSGGKGDSGSTQKTWTYSATFALVLCSTRVTGPIAGIRRIWVQGNLFYDAGSDDIESIIASNTAASTFTVYRGTETQEPDPRMQADKGVANTPAYRGRAYIVFYDLQLADYGNSLMGAQVKVEVVQSVTPIGYQTRLRQVLAGWPQKYYPKSVHAVDDGLARVYGYDPFAGLTTVGDFTYANDEALLSVLSSGAYAGQETVPEDALRTRFFSTGSYSHRVGTVGGLDVWVQEFFDDTAIGTAGRNIIPLGEIANINTVNAVGTAGSLEALLPSEVGKYLNGMAVSKDSTLILVVTGPSRADGGGTFLGGPDAYFVFDEDFEIVDSGTVTGSSTALGVCEIEELNRQTSLEPDHQNGWTAWYNGSGIEARHFDITDGVLTVNTTLSFSSFSSAVTAIAIAAHRSMFYAIVRATTDTEIIVISRDEVSFSETVLLSDIVEAECLQASTLTAGDIDVTALTDVVRGYRVTQTGAIRSAIEPLQAAWPFDMIQSGYKIKAVNRGGTSVATIDASELDARPAGEAPGPALTIVREMDTQLPRRVTIKHLDLARDYDQGEQYAERLSDDSISVRDLDMPIVLTAGEAAQKAEVLLYLYWLERHIVSFRLPPEYLALEPADVITIVAPGATYRLRLAGPVNYLSDGRLECVARYDSAAIYTPAALGEEGLPPPVAIGLAGPSRYELLDLPALNAQMDAPGFVAAMTGYTSAWPGGILFRSSDDGQTWDDIQGWSGECTMGTARNIIAAHPGGVVDAASVLQVDLISGELESITELAMLNGGNHFAYGADGRWEIIAARTCVLQADGSYKLSDMLRGRAGTEHNTGNHAFSDVVVLLNDIDNALIGVDSATIGLSRLYRGITAGRSIDSDASRAFTYNAVNLECLSPVYLNGNRHPSTNDWTLDWIRRTRIGGEWRSLVDASLSETTEAYEIDIFSSGTYATLKRTLTSATPTVAYTSVQQVTDFGSNQTTLYVRVYQMSATVGRGFPLETSITR